MSSFDMFYEEDEDVLEISFEDYDEAFSRTIDLNDHIQLHTDTNMNVVWGITIYEYATLLLVNEVDLDNLSQYPEANAHQIYKLLEKRPAAYFLETVDGSGYRARVRAPHLQEMLPTK